MKEHDVEILGVGELKKKLNFKGFSRKTHVLSVEFPSMGLLVFDLGICKRCHTILQNFEV